MDESLDILAFAPHPDDAEYGCGGSLILATDQGLQVAVADLSNGETSSRGTPEKREWERKVAAITAYESQFQSGDSGMVTTLSRPDFMRALEARAVWFGAMIGANYGEAFYSPGPVPMQTFPGLTNTPPPPGEMPPYSMY